MKKVSFVIAFFTQVSVVCFAQTNTLHPIADNTIFEENSAASNGAGGQIYVGRTAGNLGTLNRRSLIRFDMSSIPSNASITNVTLKMNCSQVPTGAVDNLIALQKCLAGWGEGASNGAGQGATATVGDATWICRFSNGGANCNSFWTIAGGDFSPIISSSVLVSGLGDYTFPNSSSLIADVQSWVNNSSANFGWILKGNESVQKTAKAFFSKEGNATATELTISYTTSTCIGANNWTGAINNSWEIPGNWSCGFVPLASTNVIIPAGSTVLVNSAAECKSLQLDATVHFTVNDGFSIKVYN
jgi:hypothetical protein